MRNPFRRKEKTEEELNAELEEKIRKQEIEEQTAFRNKQIAYETRINAKRDALTAMRSAETKAETERLLREAKTLEKLPKEEEKRFKREEKLAQMKERVELKKAKAEEAEADRRIKLARISGGSPIDKIRGSKKRLRSTIETLTGKTARDERAKMAAKPSTMGVAPTRNTVEDIFSPQIGGAFMGFRSRVTAAPAEVTVRKRKTNRGQIRYISM